MRAGRKTSRAWACSAACVAFLAAGACSAGGDVSRGATGARSADPDPTSPPDAVAARIVRVIDGDTVSVDGLAVGRPDRQGARSARLIGVDTPETSGAQACLGRQAAEYTRRRLTAAPVLVAFDVGRTDRYGRALVYLWLGPGRELFNATLAREGFASQMTVPPNVRYADLFGRLAAEARREQRGLWGDGACDQRLSGAERG